MKNVEYNRLVSWAKKSLEFIPERWWLLQWYNITCSMQVVWINSSSLLIVFCLIYSWVHSLNSFIWELTLRFSMYLMIFPFSRACTLLFWLQYREDSKLVQVDPVSFLWDFLSCQPFLQNLVSIHYLCIAPKTFFHNLQTVNNALVCRLLTLSGNIKALQSVCWFCAFSPVPTMQSSFRQHIKWYLGIW